MESVIIFRHDVAIWKCEILAQKLSVTFSQLRWISLFIFCLKDPYSQSAYVWSRCVHKIREQLTGVLVSLRYNFDVYARGSEELKSGREKGRCGFLTNSSQGKWLRHEKQLRINLKFHFSQTSFKDANFPWLRVKFSDSVIHFFLNFPKLWKPCPNHYRSTSLWIKQKLDSKFAFPSLLLI